MALVEAFRFLTILPLGGRRAPGPAALARSRAYFPVVGACLGLVLAGLDAAAQTVLPPSVTSALVIGGLAVLSGGLHLDGLMDSCDGLLARRPPAERLAIMRDSRLGSFGVTGGAVVLLVQYGCLVELVGGARLGGIVAMATLGRWAMVYASVGYPYARPEGLGAPFKRGDGWRELAVATAIAAAVAVAILGPPGLAVLGVAWLGAWLVGRYALASVQGMTGDVYGATNELVAALVLLAVVAAVERGVWLGWSSPA